MSFIEEFRHSVDCIWQTNLKNGCRNYHNEAKDVKHLHRNNGCQNTYARHAQVIHEHSAPMSLHLVMIHGVFEVDDGAIGDEKLTENRK